MWEEEEDASRHGFRVWGLGVGFRVEFAFVRLVSEEDTCKVLSRASKTS